MVWACRAKKEGKKRTRMNVLVVGRGVPREMWRSFVERDMKAMGHGHKEGNGAGEIILWVRPVLTRMIDIPCVFGVTDVKRICKCKCKCKM